MAWLLALPRVRRLGMYVAAVGASLAALAALRRSGERSGRLQEQLEQEREVSDARQRMLDASRDRPRGRDDLARRMRDGEF
ncbi:hypothetical protein DLJ53_33860 [Acuticoccus sediminis]|uniref:Uncharacterized protein n=1 Tax=Acuticoccus sediminis TaxID=2184697 RepID=A0A8B2NND1_9HYPH|nr:hypothetical protein [Acuticoccus sediminis]RAH95897.1 hypothetical protein DLJ53_33860 [Acuticoccus sediminis]